MLEQISPPLENGSQQFWPLPPHVPVDGGAVGVVVVVGLGVGVIEGFTVGAGVVLGLTVAPGTVPAQQTIPGPHPLPPLATLLGGFRPLHADPV